MEHWEQTFHYAVEHSPFYGKLFRGLKAVPRLTDLPTIDKQTVSERNEEFLCVPRAKVAEIVTTSGTTGKPLLWMLTETDLRRLARNEQLSFGCAGLTADDTVLVAVTLDRCFIAGLAYWLGLQEIGCTVVRVGITSPVMVLEMIRRLRPTAIVSVPSFLRLVAASAREGGYNLAGSSVKKAICIGEPIRESSFSLNTAGREIESAWGARVYSTYGVTELASSCCECDAGRGGHVNEEMVHLEILDDAGRIVAEGEVGEVVATTIGVEAMPLIRYRTGDFAAIFRGPCTCGRTTSRIGPIVGRKNQKLKVKGTSVFPSALVAVLESTSGVERFVIIARSEGGLSDTIEVLVEGTVSLVTLRDAFQGRTKIIPQIRQASSTEIEALQMPADARKRRTFVDLR